MTARLPNTTILLLVVTIPFLCGSIEDAHVKTRAQKMLVASDFPAYISTIYLDTNPDPKLIEILPRIEDAFNMWGKTIVPMPRGEYAYFTAPLSYPFKFTEKGIEFISDELKKIPEVDVQSISLKIFPNIAPTDQRMYPKIFTKDLIFEEQYINFKLTDWDAIEFKRFPTFLVISIDYSTASIDSPKAYSKISEYWRKKVEAFGNNHELRRALGLSENDIKTRDVPILAFASTKFHRDAKYVNRYFSGSEDWKKRFLAEVSLRPSMAKEARLIGLNFLMHEYDLITRWRFYYSTEPFFYTGEWRLRTYPGGVHGPSAKLAQVLRTVLFVHVVMPYVANQCQTSLTEVEKNLLALQKKRISFLDQFSANDLRGFQQELIHKINMREQVSHNIEKTEEVLTGLNDIKLFTESAFEIQRRDIFESTDQVPDAIFNPEITNEFFHFNRNATIHNDRQKSNHYSRLIRSRLEKTIHKASLLDGEISEANSLLESRRNMLESEKNTVYAIVIPAFGALLFGVIWLFWLLVIRR